MRTVGEDRNAERHPGGVVGRLVDEIGLRHDWRLLFVLEQVANK
jgi:hypothetical protein